MYETSGAGNPVAQEKKEPYKDQLLRIEDAMRFTARALWNEENEQSASALKLLADRLSEVQEGIEIDYEANITGSSNPIY
jgi:hypothetical protein